MNFSEMQAHQKKVDASQAKLLALFNEEEALTKQIAECEAKRAELKADFDKQRAAAMVNGQTPEDRCELVEKEEAKIAHLAKRARDLRDGDGGLIPHLREAIADQRGPLLGEIRERISVVISHADDEYKKMVEAALQKVREGYRELAKILGNSKNTMDQKTAQDVLSVEHVKLIEEIKAQPRWAGMAINLESILKDSDSEDSAMMIRKYQKIFEKQDAEAAKKTELASV